ncbi:MAG: peptidoglycan DD-metalloendopeptidase family protein [Gammaproteobacteria bacterium]
MTAIRLLLLLALTTSPVVPSLAADSGRAAVQAERLQQLRTRIGELKNELVSMHGKKNALDTELEKTEKELGAVASDLRQLDRKIGQSRTRLDELGHERQESRKKLQAVQVILARELRSAYELGQQQQVKLLLNQDDPAAIARLMTYYGYLSRARADRIRGITSVLDELALIEQQVSEQKSGLEKLKDEKIAESDRLKHMRANRKQVLVRLQAQLRKKSDELATLQRDERNLQQLVDSLRRALRDIPPSTAPLKSISPLKGKLVWPVEGRIGMPFGAVQADGKLRSRGVLVSASAGADVHAIARGQVVFADWLRGFGLLLIIDHGKGYMSLYGYNRSLFKEVGDRVEAGDLIATVGDSGGRERSGLYLELRKDGRPFDPAPWFAGKPMALRARD